jgi:phage head maturation protease
MTIHIEAADLRFSQKMMARVYRAMGMGRPSRTIRDDPDDEDASGLCVEGIAIVFDEPIATKNGEIIVFESTAFDSFLAKPASAQLWLEHNPAKVVAKGGLEFDKVKGGLVFRAPLAGSRYEATVRRMIESSEQAAVSIGVTRNRERKEKVGTNFVILVEQATIDECSIVKAGACEVAFARLAISDFATLKQSAASKPFAIEQGMHDVRVQSGKRAEKIAALAERLAGLDAELEPKKREFSFKMRGTPNGL